MRTHRFLSSLLLPLALDLGGCGEKAETTVTAGDTSSDGGGSDGASDSSDGAATEVGGATDTGDGSPTSAGSVTNAPTTGDPSGGPTSATSGETDTGTTTSAGGPTSEVTGDPTGADPTGADPDEGATQLCVDTINMYRATLGLAPLERWGEAEDCSDAECLSDGMTNTPHGAFGMCGENAQNECPGWPGPPADMITGCLELMWNEGPGDDFSKHGHYINMSNPDFTRVACGFAEVNGQIWSVQNFQ